MPLGYLITVIFIEIGALVALSPPPRQGRLGKIAFRVGVGFNELPGPALLLLLGFTLLAFAQGDISSPSAWGVVGAAFLSAVILSVVLWRGLGTPTVVDRALRRGLGDIDRPLDEVREGRTLDLVELLQTVVVPFVARRPEVERIKDVSFGPGGTKNLLDVYRNINHTERSPILIYWHGGGYGGGAKDRGALSLLYRMASQGWVCFSANYRIRPWAGFEDHIVDAKRAIVWVREHAGDYGADPDLLVISGSSAGGHMAAISALTPNDPRFQPGFEDKSTVVDAAISLGGYYGNYHNSGNELQSYTSPMDYDASTAPPFFIAHGTRDTMVSVSQARQMVAHLRSASKNPVVYAELPDGQHSFDLFRSPRFNAVMGGIDLFAELVAERETSDSGGQ